MMFVKAFAVGGFICVAGQLLLDKTKLTPARILVLFVVLGVALDAIGVFAPLKEFAGCGVTVPIMGFGSLLAEGTRKAIEQNGISGILTGPLSSGAGGIGAVIILGVLLSLVSKPRAK